MSASYLPTAHPLRIPLAAEVHSRPSLQVDKPGMITHLAVYPSEQLSAGQTNQLVQLALLSSLCQHFAVSPPAAGANYFYHDFGRFRLKWECHTEFATYTFADYFGDGEMPITPDPEIFSRTVLRHLPQTWLIGLQQQLMVAAHVLVLQERGWSKPGFAAHLLEGSVLAASQVQDKAELWTDFLIQADGCSRLILLDRGLQSHQAGRLVQRLLEIETYRMMALLGLPLAQAAAPVLNAIEQDLSALTTQLNQEQLSVSLPETEAEQQVLRQITDLAARVEVLALQNSYRFAASKAYFQIVNARIEELREQRIDGLPTIEEFMERRLTPAMQTCEAIVRRQEALAGRIANSNDLLRTRVGIVQEQQNRRILESLNARAAQQLRLQQAVEGLSVAAISYYVAGLFLYTGKGLKAMGLNLNPELITGLLIPAIAVGVWWKLRRMHSKLH